MTYTQRFISTIVFITLALVTSLVANHSAADQNKSKQPPLWLDVRSLAEYQAGHVEGAILMPHTSIDSESAATLGSKDRVIYLYCRSGGRAGLAKQTLETLGFTDITNLGSLANAQAHYDQTQHSSNN